MSNENASVSLSADPRAKEPQKVDVSLRVVVEVSFIEVFREDQTVGQMQRSVTDRAMGALHALFMEQPNEVLHFRVVDRESAELKIVTGAG